MVRLKARRNYLLDCLKNIFQFLMVRLKDSSDKDILQVFTDISIPYGAIKSKIFIHIIARNTRFQFLMVRLKDISL